MTNPVIFYNLKKAVKRILVTGLVFLLFTSLEAFAQKPRNDYEAMAQSKAKEPLLKMRDAEGNARQYRDRFLEGGGDGRKKNLAWWIKNVEEGIKFMEEAKLMHPKFKWDKLETNYEESFKNLKIEHEKASLDYKKYLKYSERLDLMYTACKSIMYSSVSLNSIKCYEQLRNFNLENFKDSTNKAKIDDPEKKFIYSLGKCVYLLEVEIPDMIQRELPKNLEKKIDEIRHEHSSKYYDELRKEFFASDTCFSALNLWFGTEQLFKDSYTLYFQKRNSMLEARKRHELEIEKETIKNYESTYLPHAKLNDPVLVSETSACIKATLDRGYTLLKVIPTQAWTYDRHTYNNQITSRWTVVKIVVKHPNGNCYMDDFTVNNYVGPGGGYKKAECESFEGYFGTAEKPRGEQIKCERVK